MKIKRVIVGNEDEGFVEDRLKDGINIISSDENNKGKTIVIQSLLYAIGNEPIFPSSFNYKDYYYIVELENDNGEGFSICRKKDNFLVLSKGNILIFETLTEFKYYLNKNIFTLPVIIKDGMKKVVDPILFYQLFFVGQDKKNTSNIFCSGYYNKNDFINMLYSIKGIGGQEKLETDPKQIRKKISELKDEKKLVEKQNKILKSNKDIFNMINASNDKERLLKEIELMEDVKNKIVKLTSKRNIALARKIKNEIVLKELKSLNRSLDAGTLHCLDCQSKNITYATADRSFAFEVSNTEIRNQILSSLEERVQIYTEEVENITYEITQCQDELKNLLKNDEISLELIIFFKDQLVDANEGDEKRKKIIEEIVQLENTLKQIESSEKYNQEEKKEFINTIVAEMNQIYNVIDPKGNLKFEELFSRRHDVFSGSESIEFYISKIYALKKIIGHTYPVIIDCFRDGELSSDKERKVLELLKSYDTQAILTATLKIEELDKYSQMSEINHIDYTDHEPCKLLTTGYSEVIKKELMKFSIILK